MIIDGLAVSLEAHEQQKKKKRYKKSWRKPYKQR